MSPRKVAPRMQTDESLKLTAAVKLELAKLLLDSQRYQEWELKRGRKKPTTHSEFYRGRVSGVRTLLALLEHGKSSTQLPGDLNETLQAAVDQERAHVAARAERLRRGEPVDLVELEEEAA